MLQRTLFVWRDWRNPRKSQSVQQVSKWYSDQGSLRHVQQASPNHYTAISGECEVGVTGSTSVAFCGPKYISLYSSLPFWSVFAVSHVGNSCIFLSLDQLLPRPEDERVTDWWCPAVADGGIFSRAGNPVERQLNSIRPSVYIHETIRKAEQFSRTFILGVLLISAVTSQFWLNWD
jgi:hypothetical protein